MSEIVERIDAILGKLGMSRSAASMKAGLSPSFIRDLERRSGNPTVKNLAKLAPVLGTTVEFLRAGEEPSGGEGQVRPPPEFFGERDLPVYAAVEGGPGEMVVSTDAIEYVPRPWFLTHVKEGYAVLVTGDSMEPVYEAGDMVLVNPKLSTRKGKDAIFIRGEHEGEFTASIKRFMGMTEKVWKVRQFNPPRGQKQDFELSKAIWQRAVRVVGKYDGT